MAKEEYSERLFKAEKEFVQKAALIVSAQWKEDAPSNLRNLSDLAHKVLGLLESGKNIASAIEICRFVFGLGWYQEHETDGTAFFKSPFFEMMKDCHYENHTAGYSSLNPLPYFEKMTARDYLIGRARYLCSKMDHVSRTPSLFTLREMDELLKTIIMIIAYRLYTGGTADEKGGGGAAVQAPKKTKVTVGQTALNF